MVKYITKKELAKIWEEPVDPRIRDWALYVRVPFDDHPKGKVLGWYATERLARFARAKDMRLGIRIREGKEWAGINLEDGND